MQIDPACARPTVSAATRQDKQIRGSARVARLVPHSGDQISVIRRVGGSEYLYAMAGAVNVRICHSS
jgi:hypothetical protein